MMNWLDVCIVLFLLFAIARGYRLGLAQQLCSSLGFFAALFFGSWVQGRWISHIQSPTTRLWVTVVAMLWFIAIGTSIGEYVGARLKVKINRHTLTERLDQLLGVTIGIATFVGVLWLGSSLLANVPANGLRQQIRGSSIIAQINKHLPPAPSFVARIGHLIAPNGFPQVFTGLEPTINTQAALPDVGQLNAAVAADRASVTKIEGSGCGGLVEGSGFVAKPGLVITNAHVVAGITQPYVLDGNGKHSAQVVLFDPDLDLAVLRTSGLKGAPLPLNNQLAADNSPAAVLGYPGGGNFTVDPATVLDHFTALGRNIYNQGETRRGVYSVKADVEPGNSGGPLVADDGSVIGVVFAESTTYTQVGYVLTMPQVVSSMANVSNNPVSTGSCAE